MSEPEQGWRRLDHVGFVVSSIEKAAPDMVQSTGTTWDGAIIHDPLQKVKVTFLRGHPPDQACLELVEGAGPDSPVERFLSRGGGLHHVCYEVDSLEEQLAHSRSHGAVIAKPPLPAVAFGGRRIAWIYSRQQLLIEFLERRRTG